MLDNSGEQVKKAAITADQVLVLTTPVDLGLARGNWVVSLGSPSDEVFEKPRQVAVALEAGKATVALWDHETGGIFITNNTPYIVPLDEGHSSQAPAGMSHQALTAAASVFAKTRLLD